MEKFSSRKFLITMLCLIGAALCVVFNVKPDADLLSFIKWIVGIYFTGNVVQKGVEYFKPKDSDVQP
jgi:hypothetical protein